MTIHHTLATHCSSVFLGKKPAALFSIPKESMPRVRGEMERALRHYGLSYAQLCDRCVNTLLFVYQPQRLREALRQTVVTDTLSCIGYPVNVPLEDVLDFLGQRVREEAEFPHEIGFFLGYPTDDVLGFMRHKGKGCKCCGLWKVYGDVPRALALFEEHRRCKRIVTYHLECGGSLYDLAVDAAG